MAKFDKAASYCPDSGPPCEESTRRERVFLENVVAIEKHNAERARGGEARRGSSLRRISRRTSSPTTTATRTRARTRDWWVSVKANGHPWRAPRNTAVEAPREVHVAAQGDGPSPNARRGTTLPVVKLGAGGGPRVASRLGDPDPAGNSATPDARKGAKGVCERRAPPPTRTRTRRSGYDCGRLSRKLCATPRGAPLARRTSHSPAFSSSSSASARRPGVLRRGDVPVRRELPARDHPAAQHAAHRAAQRRARSSGEARVG